MARQTLGSSASKAFKGLNIARQYMTYGFTTLRDLGRADPEWPTINLRQLVVAAHIISASAGHGDLRSFCDPHWTLIE